ncbi:conserved exported hypothetical protein [uncultured Stenotrophomonas sp.]|uniref:Outer membrane porin, OprD family n=1 Tax=uncultured Stenotrophomonas sp. TaxID=165438 RepID=A0A1Y5Q120_9GAMM|nr:conserved exported hypothetical protein [uncultured Stenotrophomonas sp.]
MTPPLRHLLPLLLAPAFAPAFAAEPQPAQDLRQMFDHGQTDGNLRGLYYSTANAFFADGVDRDTFSVGGRLGFTTAPLHGVSFRASGYLQRNPVHAGTGRERDLGRNLTAMGETWLQWQGEKLSLRAGNQRLDEVPFTASFDFRIVPQLYQGVRLRLGEGSNHFTAVRMFRYKSRIDESFSRSSNYNRRFSPQPPNAGDAATDGFWALGGAGKTSLGAADASGQIWLIRYLDYADLYFGQAELAAGHGSLRPFAAVQFIAQHEQGAALLGPVDNRTYGLRVGVRSSRLTATLNHNHMPHRAGAFRNGAMATPYASYQTSGPLFAQPYLTSTQDLGTGDAWSLDLEVVASRQLRWGARWSYMDLSPAADQPSIGQREYMVFASYRFEGALKGWSVHNAFAVQQQRLRRVDYRENRLTLNYDY